MLFRAETIRMRGEPWRKFSVVVEAAEREKARQVVRAHFKEGHPVRRLVERLASKPKEGPVEAYEAQRDEWPGGFGTGDLPTLANDLRLLGFEVEVEGVTA